MGEKRGFDSVGEGGLDSSGEGNPGPSCHYKKAPKLESQGKIYRKHLIVVTNRLPFSAARESDGSWSLKASSGGLVSALSGVKRFKISWIGWAGIEVPDHPGREALKVAISKELAKEFAAYMQANRMFADVVEQVYKEGDFVWIHDYHLMLLPKYLKENDKSVKIGWFLHTPFPSSDFYGILPSRNELLEAVLSSDLVGFQTSKYGDHFVNARNQLLGGNIVESEKLELIYKRKTTRVASFPIGIDCDRFTEHVKYLKEQQQVDAMKNEFPGRKLILGIDRLDLIKGITKKLQAFEKFLEDNPTLRDKVVLLQIAVPSRLDVPEYKELAKQVHENVGRINGKYGKYGRFPIHYLDRSVSFDDLCSLYASAEVALVTSIRDGMNLVSYEFIACQEPRQGVLILSEFAGAAELLLGSVIVNPWDIDQVSTSIRNALFMEPDDIEERRQLNFDYVKTHTAQIWAENFVSELLEIELTEKDVQLREALSSLSEYGDWEED